MALLDFDELGVGAQVSLTTNDRGVMSGVAIPTPGSGGLTPLAPQPASLQGGLIVDPANTTGVATAAGSATASVDGITGRVFDSWRNLVAAWGTTSPVFNVTTQIVFASSNVASDPIYFTPLSTAAITTNVFLQADLGAAAGVVRGMLLVNTTRGNSVARVNALVAGTTWELSQPLAPVNPLAYAIPAEVDTWANGDVVNAFTLLSVTVTQIAPCLSGQGFGNVTPGVFWYRMNALAVGSGSILCGQCAFVESTNSSVVVVSPSNGQMHFQNHYMSSAVINFTCQTTRVNGGLQGQFGSLTTRGQLTIDGDFMVNGGVVPAGGATIGFIAFAAAGTNIRVEFGLLRFAAVSYGGTAIYGRVSADFVLEGSSVCKVVTGSSYAAQWFTTQLVASGVVLNNANNGCSSNDGNPVTVIASLILTTVANLDAPAGAAGFGGKAFKLGGACVTNLESP